MSTNAVRFPDSAPFFPPSSRGKGKDGSFDFIPLVSKRAGGGAWTPARLPGLAACVLPALSRAQGKLWMDLSKTDPATGDGDQVRVATCPFTGVDFVAPSSGARPTLTDWGGGKWSLQSDGIDDRLDATPCDTSSFWSMSCVHQAAVNTGVIVFNGNDNISLGYGFRYQDAVSGNVLAENVANYPFPCDDPTAAPRVWVATRNAGGTVDIYADGVAAATGVSITLNTPTGTLSAFSGGNSFGIGKYSAADLFGWVQAGATLPDADRDLLTAYLSGLKPL